MHWGPVDNPRRGEHVPGVIKLPHSIERYRELLPDWEAFVEALHRPLPTDLRRNPFKIGQERFEEELGREGVTWEVLPGSPDCYRVSGLEGPGLTLAYHLGWYHPQGYTSTLPPLFLSPAPGSSVLDLCAAPGGKTSQLAAIMEGQGVLAANDINHRRLTILAANLERLAVPNALICSYRGENFPERFLFDHVLVDAPCTGQGTFRVEEGNSWREDDEDALETMPTLQERLLRKALCIVRPGGTVHYSTCSYAPEENEAVVSAVLEDGLAEVVAADGDDDAPGTLSPLPARPGLTRWEDREFPPDIAATLRFWPQDTASWGFYSALLRRTG